uniref:Uncharacterized protein n=1 Tax=viral metagenome TaxID=1070528 RepID=A0A6C0CBG7_9ZZZZ
MATYQVLLILKTLTLNEIAKIITHMCIIFYQKIKPGNIVFSSPCGHMLRYVDKFKTMTFVCPIRKELFRFNKCVYQKVLFQSSESCEGFVYTSNLVEVTNNEYAHGITCEICKRYWKYTTRKTDHEEQIMCFCGKNSDQYPCATCPIKRCFGGSLAASCIRLAGDLSNDLCNFHHRHGIVK